MTVNERFQEKRIHRGRSRTALGRRNLGFPVNLQRKDKARDGETAGREESACSKAGPSGCGHQARGRSGIWSGSLVGVLEMG